MAASRRFLQPRAWSRTAQSRLAPAAVALLLTFLILLAAMWLLPAAELKLPSAASILMQVMNIAALAFTQAPALVMVLAALFVVPLLAMTGLLVGTILQRRRTTNAQAPSAGGAFDATPAPTAVTAPRNRAFIEIAPDRVVALTDARTRLGRHEDNEVRVSGPTVHRRHALIERDGGGAYSITDLSGADGNGMFVNGERQARARLANGDVIRLGETELRFSMTPA